MSTAVAAPDRSSTEFAQSVADELLNDEGRPWAGMIERFIVEPYVDSEGEDAYQVYVLTHEAPNNPDAESAVMRALIESFFARGIERYPYTRIMSKAGYERLGEADE